MMPTPLMYLMADDGLTFEGVPIVGLSAPVLLGIFVLLVFRGFLVPRKTYEDMKEDRDFWRAAHAVSEEARLMKDQQMEVVKEIGQSVTMFSRSLDEVIRHQHMGVTETGREAGS